MCCSTCAVSNFVSVLPVRASSAQVDTTPSCTMTAWLCETLASVTSVAAHRRWSSGADDDASDSTAGSAPSCTTRISVSSPVRLHNATAQSCRIGFSLVSHSATNAPSAPLSTILSRKPDSAEKLHKASALFFLASSSSKFSLPSPSVSPMPSVSGPSSSLLPEGPPAPPPTRPPADLEKPSRSPATKSSPSKSMSEPAFGVPDTELCSPRRSSDPAGAVPARMEGLASLSLSWCIFMREE
mmetsp:Transcript_112276/g.272691  ORF Transcript_112276/g.272691 Transcript_112276/m.272691 type:complete len:241 (+) Transcript_112276:2229-2951(+)